MYSLASRAEPSRAEPSRAAEPSRRSDPDRPNIAPTIWRTVSDLTSGLYFCESAFDPNIVWSRIADLDLSVGQPALKLDLHGESDLVGYAMSRLLPSDPFELAAPDEVGGDQAPRGPTGARLAAAHAFG